jgi:hypothetical protein
MEEQWSKTIQELGEPQLGIFLPPTGEIYEPEDPVPPSPVHRLRSMKLCLQELVPVSPPEVVMLLERS